MVSVESETSSTADSLVVGLSRRREDVEVGVGSTTLTGLRWLDEKVGVADVPGVPATVDVKTLLLGLVLLLPL